MLRKIHLSFLKGFTLLELSFVLTISGLIMSIIYPRIEGYLYFRKMQKTKDHQEQIFYALSQFAVQKRRLPCPSELKVNDLIGIEKKECAIPSEAQGVLPYKSLGIPKETALDGFGHYFTYAVEPSLTENYRTLHYNEDSIYHESESFCATPIQAQLTLKDDKNKDVSTENKLSLVLISHGDKGEGAFLKTGQRKAVAIQDPIKTLNANLDLHFIDKGAKNRSDDLIFWSTREQLLAFYAKQPCIIKKENDF